jgi:hypothetical protein
MSSTLLGRTKFHKFPNCERNGVDQGVHNVLVYSQMKDFKVNFEQDLPFVNMQSSVYSRYKASNPINSSVVLHFNDNDVRVAAVVHQYDRSHELQLKLGTRFIDWVNINDISSEWEAEESCKAFSFAILESDLLQGECDYASARVMTAASCCSVCTRQSECKAFSFTNGNCFLKSCINEASSGNAKQSLAFLNTITLEMQEKMIFNAFKL